MATVPFDVQAIVIDWVYRSSQERIVDYETLRVCALVCRSWTPVAQRLLFRRISVVLLPYFKHGVESFVFLLRTLRAAPHEAAYVRSIILDIKPFHRDAAFENNTFSLLELCTNVDGIFMEPDISVNAGQAFFIERLLAAPVRPVFLSVRGDSALVDEVINNWPSVRVLRLHLRPTDDATRVRMPRTLQALMVYVYHGHPGHRWKAPSAAVMPALRDLELDNSNWTNTAQFEALVESGVLPQLRTLSLLLRGPYAPPRAFTDALAGLETLIISTLPEKACVLPPGLWHLGFHNSYFAPEDQVARAQLLLDAARALPKLRLVTATRLLSKEVLDAFKRVCRDCKVNFTVYERLECFPRPQHVDWI